MNFAETLVFVAAGSPASWPVRSGCTRILLSEDRELQPHPVLPALQRCIPDRRHCAVAHAHCGKEPSGCNAAAVACG